MKYAFLLLLIVLMAFPEAVRAQHGTKADPVALSGIADTVGRACDQADYARTFTKANDSTVGLYGYSLLSHPWACRVLSTSWLKTGNVVRLRKITTDVDDYHLMTLVSIPGDGRPWVIVTLEGMTAPQGFANDPHNRAAFNALVRVNHERPTEPTEWVSFALLYLNMIGYRVRVADSTHFGEQVRGLLSRSRELSKYRLLPTVIRDGDTRTVVVNDLFGSARTHRYMRWTLTFTVQKNGVLLSDVERETEKLPARRLGRKGR